MKTVYLNLDNVVKPTTLTKQYFEETGKIERSWLTPHETNFSPTMRGFNRNNWCQGSGCSPFILEVDGTEAEIIETLEKWLFIQPKYALAVEWLKNLSKETDILAKIGEPQEGAFVFPDDEIGLSQRPLVIFYQLNKGIQIANINNLDDGRYLVGMFLKLGYLDRQTATMLLKDTGAAVVAKYDLFDEIVKQLDRDHYFLESEYRYYDDKVVMLTKEELIQTLLTAYELRRYEPDPNDRRFYNPSDKTFAFTAWQGFGGETSYVFTLETPRFVYDVRQALGNSTINLKHAVEVISIMGRRMQSFEAQHQSGDLFGHRSVDKEKLKEYLSVALKWK